jgi:hypothetical protein
LLLICYFFKNIILKETYLIFRYFNTLFIDTLNKYTLIGLPLAIGLKITITSAGLTNSAYAHGSKVKVGCKDLAIDLISWDALYKYIDLDDLTDSEDVFCDDN